jgi:hypothetical protein
MQILDREELERRACDCYAHHQRYVAKLFASTQNTLAQSPSIVASSSVSG